MKIIRIKLISKSGNGSNLPFRLLKKSPCIVAVHPVNPHVCLIRCGCPSSGALQDELFQQPIILMTLSSIGTAVICRSFGSSAFAYIDEKDIDVYN
ncbi:hypothetical protein [Sedimentibacter sp.]|uniref:hypothetical protein n=1 Tax=Sedimentibacter sp. TaxID=1960295 RepID=UPI0028B1B775|nr:hypothetical protein [Sedimentibacter sp.]